MVKGRLIRESNPAAGIPGYAPQHDSTGEEDYVRTSPLNPLPTEIIGGEISLNDQPTDYPDSAVKEELEQIKATQAEILDRLNRPIDTQVTGSNVEEAIPVKQNRNHVITESEYDYEEWKDEINYNRIGLAYGKPRYIGKSVDISGFKNVIVLIENNTNFTLYSRSSSSHKIKVAYLENDTFNSFSDLKFGGINVAIPEIPSGAIATLSFKDIIGEEWANAYTFASIGIGIGELNEGETERQGSLAWMYIGVMD